jgi:hypothetical protein
MTEQKENEQTSEATDLERRAFVMKTAALTGAIGVAGAAGVAANVAAATETSAVCGPNPRTMTVTFDFHSAGRSKVPNFTKLMQHVTQSGELVLGLTKRFTDDNGWGEWLRDASRDSEAMDLRMIAFHQVPFRTGG